MSWCCSGQQWPMKGLASGAASLWQAQASMLKRADVWGSVRGSCCVLQLFSLRVPLLWEQSLWFYQSAMRDELVC